jgi:SNF2 Helicase protein
MERAGLVIRMPANWRMNRPSRPSVEATVGSTSPSVLGMDALLDFRVAIILAGKVLTEDEIDDVSTLKARSPRPDRDSARIAEPLHSASPQSRSSTIDLLHNRYAASSSML